MGMIRGDLVTVVLPGAYGKPRPALIIQSDLFQDHPSVTVLPVTSELRETPIFRILIQPNSENGLVKTSQIMIDKIQTIPREKMGEVIGSLGSKEMRLIQQALAVFIGLAS